LPVKVLLWHGYLLSGSGSNVYTLNVAAAWRRQGHDVLLMCQDRNSARLPVVDGEGRFDPHNRHFEIRPTGNPAGRGSFVVVCPDIGGLLPVYVYDDYEGFLVKRFVDLTDDELESYTRSNVTAMERAIDEFAPDVVVTGHEVMGPYIARLACSASGMGYVAKLHGSALEYAVKLQDRYLRYAHEGLSGASRVVGGSRYMLEEAAAIVPGWIDRGVVINPGVDVDLFEPRAGRIPDATVGYVGKLIVEKGVHNLIGALGLTHADGLNVVVVGYGGDERPMRELADALSLGALDRARAVAAALDRADHLSTSLDRVGAEYVDRARAVPIEFTGRLEHDPLSELLPTFDVLVAPSIVSEAFGMVAAEAAACGVLPLVPRHSGIREAGEAVEAVLSAPGLLTFDPADPVEGIAAGIDRILTIDAPRRLAMGADAARHARAEWSWERIAERLLEAAV
jgi:glycosyltransferase involved in cell wall biosynthesis